MGSLLKFCACF